MAAPPMNEVLGLAVEAGTLAPGAPVRLPILGFLALSACYEPGENAIVRLGACAGGADVSDVTHIAWDFETSAHEMIVCGHLSNLLVSRLVQSATGFALDPASMPGAFRYEDGVYITEGDGVSMELWFEYGANTPVGEVSVEVDVNLFELDSYLQGGERTDNADGSVTIHFEAPGPLAPMLGHGETPESPLVLQDADTALLAAAFGTLRLRGRMLVDDEATLSTITYELDFPENVVLDLLTGEPMALTLVAAGGERPELNQTIETIAWDLDYRDLTGTLEGDIQLAIVGGPFDFRAQYTYLPVSVEPVVSLSCL